MEVPGAAQHTDADKAGYLTKLSSRSFPYIPQWKRRYCVLTKAKLYYYEREDSKQGEKSSGVINLEYFDQVAEAGPKDCKKATNVFVITSQDRSFFDPGRHLFSADTLPDMKDWIRKLQTALDQIRNNNRPANSTSTSTSTKEGGKRRKEEVLEIKENNTLTSASKERKKKKEDSHRQRKTARVGASEEGVSPGVMAGVVEHPRSPPAKGIQLPGLAVPQGIQLPGMTAPKKVEVTEPQKEAMEVDDEDGLPTAGPTLTCVTKRRVRGPSGRRAPQNRRTQIAAATQKRASSLTALEFQELNDTSEAPWLNQSLDMLDGGDAHNSSSHPSLGAATYRYSSEDEGDDNSQADSLPTSASAMPPPPPPRSASYGMELRRPTQLAALPHHALGEGRAGGSARDLQESGQHGEEAKMAGGAGEWRGSSGDAWIMTGNSGDHPSGASPVMDDLDNLLMNQSIQHTSGALDSTSDVGSEGSSTYRGDHHHHKLGRKKTPDLSQFTTAVRHLQRHVVEIDRAIYGISRDVTGTRQDLSGLKEAVAALQADADTITSTLSHLTHQAITAQHAITHATQVRCHQRRLTCAALATTPAPRLLCH